MEGDGEDGDTGGRLPSPIRRAGRGILYLAVGFVTTAVGSLVLLRFTLGVQWVVYDALYPGGS